MKTFNLQYGTSYYKSYSALSTLLTRRLALEVINVLVAAGFVAGTILCPKDLCLRLGVFLLLGP